MALLTIENKIANRIGYGGLLAGTGAIGLAFAAGHSSHLLAASTGAYALSAASFIAGRLYDHAGQKIAVWQTLRTCSKAVGIANAVDVEQTAARLQHLEHAIDHRIDVVGNSATERGQVAMGAWVHAAKQVLAKSQLFDVAASPIDRDPLKLTSSWPTVARQIESRMEGYNRMLNGELAQPMPKTICNFDYPAM
jgi:hypothetical protein